MPEENGAPFVEIRGKTFRAEKVIKSSYFSLARGEKDILNKNLVHISAPPRNVRSEK
jgi:hypothetical protein